MMDVKFQFKMDSSFLGQGVKEAMQEAKVLLVGAGGIGCELLKDLILMEIGEIHVLDLDTIDLSNLNRQFLFRQKDIKQSKSLTAVKAVGHFNLNSRLVAHHGNIMDAKTFPLKFFSQFDIIYNALDNLEARLYVNRMALFTRIPLFESGTTGNKGQVQPIYPYLSECFHCMPKETPKTFPVCTIRSTPSKPIHSITWAKNFLLSQLFGERDQDSINISDFTNEEEARAKMKEANELNDLKESIFRSKGDEGDLKFIFNIIEKIYQDDIRRLISIDALWKSRPKPKVLPEIGSLIDMELGMGEYLRLKFNSQENLDLQHQVKMFIKSTLQLTFRVLKGEVIEFDKDDLDTLEFVVSSSNIRSHLFDIPLKSAFDIKQIAGNIIPAVATTNAIMAGFSALTSLQFFANDSDERRCASSKMIYDSNSYDKFVNSTKLAKPDPNCKSCSIVRGVIRLNLKSATIEELRDGLVDKYGYEDDVEIISGLDSRLLYDYDMDDNLEKLVGGMIKEGDLLQIGDSSERLDLIELYVENGDAMELPDIQVPEKSLPQQEEDEEGFAEDIVENVGVEAEGGVIELEDEEVPAEPNGGLKRSFDEEVNNDDKRIKL